MSHITAASDKVIKACELYMMYCEFNRDMTQLNAIKKEANSKTFWCFGKPIGYEKALKNIQNAGVFEYAEYYTATWICGKKYDLADNIRLLAKNGDPVIISDNAAFIFDKRWEEDLFKWGVITETDLKLVGSLVD